MMPLKYDFNITQNRNIFFDVLVYVNDNTSHLATYFIVAMLGLVALWVFNRYTDDSNLSFVYALFMSTILGIILYYAGLYFNETLFSGVILMGMIVMLTGLSGVLYYSRSKMSGD